MTGPALISLTEARRRLGVGPVALANLIREGHLRTRMVQGRKQARQLVVAASLQEWLDAGSPEPRQWDTIGVHDIKVAPFRGRHVA